MKALSNSIKDLKPCPFCGADVHYISICDESDNITYYSIACNTLRCYGSESRLFYRTREDALYFWNKRKSS